MNKIKGPAPFTLDNRFVSAKQMGFTLIELLVAVSIFAVIAVVLYSCFRGGIVSYRRILQEASSQQRLRYMLSVMEKDFKNAFSMANMPFQGADNEISFTSIITEADNSAMNAGRISYYLKETENDYILARKTESLSEALNFFISESIIDSEKLSGTVSGKEEIIAEGISGISFTYLCVENLNPELSEQQEEESEGTVSYEWVDLWEKDTLPIAVRAEISFNDSANTGVRQVTKRVWIPAASPMTPELSDALS
jgi:prepilin-type N-terminal cleavage/methylation domain-containing protein